MLLAERQNLHRLLSAQTQNLTDERAREYVEERMKNGNGDEPAGIEQLFPSASGETQRELKAVLSALSEQKEELARESAALEEKKAKVKRQKVEAAEQRRSIVEAVKRLGNSVT